MIRCGFTMIEILVVTLIIGVIITSVLLLMSGAFTGATKGMGNLAQIQEQSRLLAVLKQDLRTLIIGGFDNVPPPTLLPLSEDPEDKTISFEFNKVYTIDEVGRPLIEKVIYQTDPGSPENFSVIRIGETDNVAQRRYAVNMLSGFKIQLLDSLGEVITTQANLVSMKKVRLTMQTPGNDRLTTVVSVYSPYVKTAQTRQMSDLWYPNYMFNEYSPGAPVRIFQGGTIQISGNITLGRPLSLTGAVTIE